ncbi:ash family protein [Enterobacter hormaechei]|uniref:ash family protein n=1 Tax=Enterobacter hormaechei TaxID=158836 RepID=UPI0039C86084
MRQIPQPGFAIPNHKTTHNTRQRVFLCVKSAHTRIMVAQMGLTSVGPVSFCAGIANPVWATTL